MPNYDESVHDHQISELSSDLVKIIFDAPSSDFDDGKVQDEQKEYESCSDSLISRSRAAALRRRSSSCRWRREGGSAAV